MSRFVRIFSGESFYDSSGLDKGCGFPIVYNTSSGTCKDSVNIFSTTNCGCKEKNELSDRNKIKHQVRNRVNLVDREFEALQWLNFFSFEPTSNFSNRCFPDKVGSSLQCGSNIRVMVRGRENLAHKCVATISNKIDSIFLHQREKSESHTLIDKEQGRLVLPFENGGNKEHIIRLSKEIWHYLLNRNMYITVEYLPSGLNTVAARESSQEKKNRLFRVASSSQSFSRVFLITRFSDNISICFPPMPKIGTNVFLMYFPLSV